MLPLFPDYSYKPVSLSSGENMPRVIDASKLADSYKKGVGSKGDKWRDNFLATTGIAEAGKSDAAETQYAVKVTEAVSKKLRQKGLKDVTDETIKAPVRSGSSSMYTGPAQNKAPKFASKFAPYVPTINAQVATLKPREASVDANIDNRVKPIANALHNQKVGSS